MLRRDWRCQSFGVACPKLLLLRRLRSAREARKRPPDWRIDGEIAMAEQPGEAIASALQWVSRIFAVVMLMCLPGLAGQWLDRRFGTNFLGAVGFVGGLVLGMWSLIVMANASSDRRRTTRHDAGNETNSNNTDPNDTGDH